VKIRRAALRAFRLPLVKPLATAHGAIAERRGWLLRIEDLEGRVGLGEATPLPEFGTENPVDCERALRQSLKDLIDLAPGIDADSATEVFSRCCEARPTARAALECALADLAAQRASLSLGAYWRRMAGVDGEPAETVRIQSLVGGETPESVFESAALARSLGHRAYKLKLCVTPESTEMGFDLDRVAALRDAVGVDAMIRLDANEAWTLDAARDALTRLARFEIDFVEQPVPRSDLEGLSILDREAPIPVAADEALLGDGLERCIEMRAARILVVKPAAIGGFGIAIALLRQAREHGLRIVWSSLLDGAVSRMAALHLAAALGPDREVHGLGTGALLKEDLEAGPPIESGAIALPRAVGLGLTDGFRDAEKFVTKGPPWTDAAEPFGSSR
jgi:o-succinylbenzoate synthase